MRRAQRQATIPERRSAAAAISVLQGIAAAGCITFAIAVVASGHGDQAKKLTLTPVTVLHSAESTPSIINGQLVNGEDFPVSFQAKIDDHVCTFFLAASRTLFTAAHCVQSARVVEIKTPAKSYSGECEFANAYKNDPSQDWALCLLSSDYEIPQFLGHPISGYEVLGIDATVVLNAKRVLITGFGCAKEGEPADNAYRFGWAAIGDRPPNARPPGMLSPTPHFLQLRSSLLSPAELCEGDSGGPAFVTFDASADYRTVIAINSRTVHGIHSSYVASVSTKEGLEFIENWATAKAQKICGIAKDAENCRPTRP